MLATMRPKQYLNIVADQADPQGTEIDWGDLCTLTNLQARRGHRDRQAAVHIRNHLRSYYNAIGAVDWQEHAAMAHVSTYHYC